MTSRFSFAVHNIVGHPISEVLWWFGFVRASEWVHDATLPKMNDQQPQKSEPVR